MRALDTPRSSKVHITRSIPSAILPWCCLLLCQASHANLDVGSAGIDLAGIDSSVAPGDNFFTYANGKWLTSASIPADRSSWGVGEELIEATNQRVSALIKELNASRDARQGDARKIADYFASYMDEATIEAKGLAPLAPTLKRIAGIGDRVALAHWLGETIRADVDVLNATNLYTDNPLGLWIAQDLDDPDRYLPFLLQGGLGMPDREYYLSKSPQMAEIRRQYRAHIARVLRLSGTAAPAEHAAAIFQLETKLAAAHGSREEASDVRKGNNHWRRQDFDTRAPGMNWSAFLQAAKLGEQQDFVIWQPGALAGLASLVRIESLSSWKAYLRFHAIEHSARYLSKALVAEQFNFYGTVLNGTPVMRERWKRGVDATNDALGEAVGKLYVERYFPADAKAKVQSIVQDILRAYEQRIDRLDWMAPQTRANAKAKLATLKVGVGFPDRWRDYSGLEVVRGDAYGNFLRTEQFELQRNLRKLGQPVDRGEWVMTPQTVNAVNLPAMNAMNFPAAILQAPYFSLENLPAANYGAIGATIGHEISHSFDDQGALFDAAGRFQNWWTPKDLEQFHRAAAKLTSQYDQYRPLPDLPVNGKQTLSENIADVAGLAAALDAYHASLAGQPAPRAQGFSGDQQFFIAFSQSWRGKYREPLLRQIIVTDNHSPNEQRALTVRNLTAWYAAFEIKPGQALYLEPNARVQVW